MKFGRWNSRSENCEYKRNCVSYPDVRNCIRVILISMHFLLFQIFIQYTITYVGLLWNYANTSKIENLWWISKKDNDNQNICWESVWAACVVRKQWIAEQWLPWLYVKSNKLLRFHHRFKPRHSSFLLKLETAINIH